MMQKTQVASRMFPALPTREDIQAYVLWHCIDIMSKQSYHPYVLEQRKHVGSHFMIPFFLLCLFCLFHLFPLAYALVWLCVYDALVYKHTVFCRVMHDFSLSLSCALSFDRMYETGMFVSWRRVFSATAQLSKGMGESDDSLHWNRPSVYRLVQRLHPAAVEAKVRRVFSALSHHAQRTANHHRLHVLDAERLHCHWGVAASLFRCHVREAWRDKLLYTPCWDALLSVDLDHRPHRKLVIVRSHVLQGTQHRRDACTECCIIQGIRTIQQDRGLPPLRTCRRRQNIFRG